MPVRKNRGKIEIIADILNLSVSGIIKKTHIMFRANLSYEQTTRYLEELQNRGFLEERLEEGIPVYGITEKGREFVDIFSNINMLVNGRKAKASRQYTWDRD